MARGSGDVPGEFSTSYETVARWVASFQRSGLRPVDDRARKLELLEQFCASVGVDPDTLVAKARADRDAKNGYLKELVAWAKSLPGTDLVVMDDLIYGEPVPAPGALALLGLSLAVASGRRAWRHILARRVPRA